MKKGFTLIELLVVIAIIGLLSSVVLASLNSSRIKARDARRISDLHQIQLALELYKADSPTSDYPVIGYWVYSTDSSWNTLQQALQLYMPNLPKDPINNGPWPWGDGESYYSYAYGNNGAPDKHYDLVAHLEDKSSSLRCGVRGTIFHLVSPVNGPLSWCNNTAGVPPYATYSQQLYSPE